MPQIRRFPGVLVAILVVAAVVRLVVIGRDALWLDEGYSWWDALQSLAALWTLVPTCDPHPPLYFALLHGWIAAFGDATVTMRLLSTCFGVATVAVVYLAGRELDRARGAADRPFGIGAFAALLFALTPFQIYFSIEARPYALLCLGAALLTLGALRAVRIGRERRLAFEWSRRLDRATVLLLAFGGIVVVWTNNTAALVLGAATVGFVALWLFDRDSRSTIVPIVAIGVVVAVLWMPDWGLLIRQSREVTQDFWIPRPSFAGITFELHNLIGLDVLRLTWWMVFVAVCGLCAVRLRIGTRWAVILAAFAILPIAFNIVVSYVMAPILISRALIGAAPALALALAASAVMLRSRSFRLVAIAGLLIAHGYAVGRFVSADHVKEPWKAVVARLAAVADGATVLVVPNELVMPLDHEAQMQRSAFRVRGVPADYPATGLDARYPSGKCAPSVVDQDLAPLVASLAADPGVVLLTRSNNTYDPHEEVAAALRRGGFRVASDDVFQPGDLHVTRFVHAPR